MNNIVKNAILTVVIGTGISLPIGLVGDVQFNNGIYTDRALCAVGFEEGHCASWTDENGTVWFNNNTPEGRKALEERLNEIIEALADAGTTTEDDNIVTVPDGCEVELAPRQMTRIPKGCSVSGDVYVSTNGREAYEWAADHKDLTGQIIVVLTDNVWVKTQDHHGAYVHGKDTDLDALRTEMLSPGNGGCGLAEGCYKVVIAEYTPTGVQYR